MQKQRDEACQDALDMRAKFESFSDVLDNIQVSPEPVSKVEAGSRSRAEVSNILSWSQDDKRSALPAVASNESVDENPEHRLTEAKGLLAEVKAQREDAEDRCRQAHCERNEALAEVALLRAQLEMPRVTHEHLQMNKSPTLSPVQSPILPARVLEHNSEHVTGYC